MFIPDMTTWLSWQNLNLVLCLIETVWSVLLFFHCSRAIADNMKSFTIREDYYIPDEVDYSEFVRVYFRFPDGNPLITLIVVTCE